MVDETYYSTYSTVETVPQSQDDMTKVQYYVLANVQRGSAFLSLCGSLYIIREIIIREYRKNDNRLENVYHRIMLVLSISDCISSLAFFASNWAIPSNVAYDFIRGNIGNITTCDIQAFMIILGWCGIVVSNTVLSVYFLLCVKYNWSNDRLKRQLERPYHLLLVLGGIPYSIGPLFWDLYNPTINICFLELYPYLCNKLDNDVECFRGDADAYRLFFIMFYFIPVPIALTIILVSMISLYRTVRRQEEQAKTYASNATLVQLSRNSRQVYLRAVWYIVSFFIVWVPGLLLILNDYSYMLQIIAKLFMPMQGMFIAVV